MVTLAALKCKLVFTKKRPSFIILNVIIGKKRVTDMDEHRFCDILAALRRSKGVSQRKAAAELHISQALLSHYENGAREPGLPFLCRACDYYGVTADYLLGRADSAAAHAPTPAALREMADAMRALAEQVESYAG